MSTIIVFVKYNGPYDENNVCITNNFVGILIPMSTSYVHLLEILFEALKLNPENYVMCIKHTFELGCTTVKIVNDHSVKFYL